MPMFRFAKIPAKMLRGIGDCVPVKVHIVQQNCHRRNHAGNGRWQKWTSRLFHPLVGESAPWCIWSNVFIIQGSFVLFLGKRGCGHETFIKDNGACLLKRFQCPFNPLFFHPNLIKFDGSDVLLSFWFWLTDLHKILHMPWQLCCHGMCIILWWSDEREWNYSEISLWSNLNDERKGISEMSTRLAVGSVLNEYCII